MKIAYGTAALLCSYGCHVRLGTSSCPVLVARLVRLFATPWTVAPWTWFLCPWNSPGKNTGVDCHSLLQGIFLTQGSIPGLLHCRQFLYHLSHQGKPNIIYSIIQILKKVNVPFLLVHSGQLNYFCFFAWLASFPDPPPLPGLLAGLSIMRSSCSRKAITTISCSNGRVTLAGPITILFTNKEGFVCSLH